MAFNWGGAASGAAAGSSAGPWGAAIGGLAGGLLGGDSGPSAPKPPDYAKAAAKQRQWDQAMWQRQLREGRRTQTGPTGTIRYTPKGDQIVKLDPQQKRNLRLSGSLQEDVLRGEIGLTGRRVANERDRLRRIDDLRTVAGRDYRGEAKDAAGGREYTDAVRNMEMGLLPRQEDLWRDRSRSEDAYTDYLMGKIKSGETLTDDEERAFKGRLATEKAAKEAQRGWYDFQSTKLPQFGEAFNKGVDMTTAFSAPSLEKFNERYAKQLGDQMYGSVMSRLNPEQKQAEEAMGNRLRASGLQPGTEAYDRAMKNLLTSHGDVRSKAALDAQAAAWQEARARYGQDIDAFRAMSDSNVGSLGAMTGALGNLAGVLNPNDYRAGSAPGADQSLLLQAGNTPRFQAGLAPNLGEVSQLIAGGGYTGDAGSVMTTPNLPSMYLPGSPPSASGSFMDAAQAQYQANVGGWNVGQQNQADWNNMVGKGVGALADWWTNRTP